MPQNPIRVMLVDDSSVIRGFLNRAIAAEKDMEVVCTAVDGQAAVDQAKQHELDVIVLDIEMPRMDGLTAIPLLLAARPNAKIMMASTLTLRNADISLKAIQAGAADYIPKPDASGLAGASAFNAALIEKIRVLGAFAHRERSQGPGRLTAIRTLPPSVPLQPLRAIAPRAIAIGSSTGGPQAVLQVMRHLRGVPVPIFLTQHMPPNFTTILAEHIRKQCDIDAVEVHDGMEIVAGRVHVAPGDYHMGVAAHGAKQKIALNKGPPENFCRPAVDVMLRSLVAAYGSMLLAVILTGLGKDGLLGCQPIQAGGGVIVAQDEATSVVWGMPGAVATAGLCAAVLPVQKIGPWVEDFMGKKPIRREGKARL